MKRATYFIFGLFLALTIGALAADSVTPSRLRILSLGVNAPAPSVSGHAVFNRPTGGGGSDILKFQNNGVTKGSLQVTSNGIGLYGKSAQTGSGIFVDSTTDDLILEADSSTVAIMTGSSASFTSEVNALTLRATNIQRNHVNGPVPLPYGVAISCTASGSNRDLVNATSCARNGTGLYTVTFNIDVSNGVCTASIHDTSNNGFAKISNVPMGPTVNVDTFDTSFTLADRAFSVVCLVRI